MWGRPLKAQYAGLQQTTFRTSPWFSRCPSLLFTDQSGYSSSPITSDRPTIHSLSSFLTWCLPLKAQLKELVSSLLVLNSTTPACLCAELPLRANDESTHPRSVVPCRLYASPGNSACYPIIRTSRPAPPTTSRRVHACMPRLQQCSSCSNQQHQHTEQLQPDSL